ncbi:MAG TPA: amidohydrolase [Candidatus Angelobacter sp.]|nr:amidohydrolase [Candidatus Angelobacter sp.]
MTRWLSWTTVLLMASTCVGAGENAPTPDLLLLHGKIITMDPARPSGQAIAIQGDRIVWVGNDQEAQKRFSHAHQIIDLHGATVLPGIIDAHTHLFDLGESLLRLNLKDVATAEEVVARVSEKAGATVPGEWILGWGWDEGKWASNYPDNAALSRASPNNPVYLVGLHGFAAWANKRALEAAGITATTKDPENGTILRDPATGLPTGILLNRAQALVESRVPAMTPEQTKKAIELATQECVRNGLTSVHEARVSAAMIQAYHELLQQGRLPVRIYAMLDGADQALVETWLARGPEIDPHHQLTIRSFKLFADGALGSRGALLLEPYSDAPQSKGTAATPESAIYDLTRRSLKSGFQVCTHAIGDAANRMTLDAYGRALHETPSARDARLRIEHAQVLAPEDIPRFAQIGVIPSMQPTHATSDMIWAEKRVGPIRIKGAYAWRSLLKTGVHLPLSSDFPGETLNPFYGIYAAITRQDPNGSPDGGWHPEQRLTIEEALRGYTREAAYAEFAEKQKGSLEPGKLADLIVLDKDIRSLASTPKELLSIRVMKTFVGGRLVYDASSRGTHPNL